SWGYGSVSLTIVLTTRVCSSARLHPRIMSTFRQSLCGRVICTISLVIAATNIAVEREPLCAPYVRLSPFSSCCGQCFQQCDALCQQRASILALTVSRRASGAPGVQRGRPGRRGECHAQRHGEHAELYRRCAVQVGVEWKSAPRDWTT